MAEKDNFCKIQPRFIKTNTFFGSLQSDMKLLYLAIWIHAFDARTETLEINDNLILTLQLMTQLPKTIITRALFQDCNIFATLLTKKDNILIVNGLHKIHRGIRIKNTILRQECSNNAKNAIKNRIEENRIEENRIEPTTTVFSETSKTLVVGSATSSENVSSHSETLLTEHSSDSTNKKSADLEKEKEEKGLLDFFNSLEMYSADDKLRKVFVKLACALHSAYPKINILSEILRAQAWELTKPNGYIKSHAQFIRNWIARAEKDRLQNEKCS